jgi:hypothetical protein
MRRHDGLIRGMRRDDATQVTDLVDVLQALLGGLLYLAAPRSERREIACCAALHTGSSTNSREMSLHRRLPTCLVLAGNLTVLASGRLAGWLAGWQRRLLDGHVVLQRAGRARDLDLVTAPWAWHCEDRADGRANGPVEGRAGAAPARVASMVGWHRSRRGAGNPRGPPFAT